MYVEYVLEQSDEDLQSASLQLIMENPNITQKEIADRVAKSE